MSGRVAGLRLPAPMPGWRDRVLGWRDALLAMPGFQRWAIRFPLTRPIARRQTRALFDLCAGFVYAQVLTACVRLDVFGLLAAGPMPLPTLAARLGLAPERATRLLDAAVSLGLLERRGGGRYGLGMLGAASVGNPGIAAMVEHHARLYADLADPVALLRSDAPGPALSAYWPYATAGEPAALAARDVAPYSALMAASQPMIAAEVVRACRFSRHRCLLDVGGGEGAFVQAVAATAPELRLKLFDLPEVAARARARFAATGLSARAEVFGGDFRAAALPRGADIVSLVRVLHDHDDDAALALLRRVRAALPEGGTVLVAEPMSGTQGAEPVGDAYFGFYLLAMGSGRPRTPGELTDLLRTAGFGAIRLRRTGQPLLARVLTARAVRFS